MAEQERVACRTPAQGRDGVTRVPRWKFDLLRRLILEVVGQAGQDGARFSDLAGAVKTRLSAEERAALGSVGWHVTTVKLEMEVAGDLRRLPGSPQRLVLGADGGD